jgi:hypothetical protein
LGVCFDSVSLLDSLNFVHGVCRMIESMGILEQMK